VKALIFDLDDMLTDGMLQAAITRLQAATFDGFAEVKRLKAKLTAAKDAAARAAVNAELAKLIKTTRTQLIEAAFAGTAVGGVMEAGEECQDVQVFAPDAMPDMAFPHDGAILEAWSRGGPLPIRARAEAG